MNKFSSSIYKAFTESFPDLHHNVTNSQNPELDIPSVNKSPIGGLVIQSTKEKNIWLRNYHPYSSYLVDNTDELINLMQGIFNDEILWCISFQGDQWFETTLLRYSVDLKSEKEITYKVLSWSGNLDKNFSID